MTTSWRPKVYLTGVQKRDKALQAIGKGLGAEFLHADHTHLSRLPVLWGFGDPTEGKIVRCMREKRPFLHLDHAYFKRGYEHGNVRVNFGHFHQTKILEVPDDRSLLARKRVELWRKGRDVIVVVPSERICNVLAQLKGIHPNPKEWCRTTELELKKHTDRPIVRKEKGGSFLDAIKNAHAVVSLSSVAEVESVIHGVPVFVTEDSPAFPMSSGELSGIEEPIYPDRDMWLRSLSYSQFHLSELSDGKTIRTLERIYGDLELHRVANSS